MKTVRVSFAECRLPLARPMTLGAVTIATRDFVALRIETDDGTHGDALGYTRGTPLFETLQSIGHHFVGICPHHRRAELERFNAAHVNGKAGFVRATSLIDIALHDIAAKSVKLPLFRMLGGNRTRIPVSRVAGYRVKERSVRSVCDEVASHFDAGFRQTKIMIDGGEVARDAELVEAAAARSVGRLGVDAHWSWDTITQAAAACRLFDNVGLAFIEDPFGPHRSRWMRDLQARLRTPLACGEDVADVDTLASLSRDIPVLRVDATTCGGIGAACSAIEIAAANGCEVFPHVHISVHAQLAAVYGTVGFVEEIAPEVGVDPGHLLLERQPRIVDGLLHVDEEPGAGSSLNWAAVERYAAKTASVTTQG
jgi:L-alanine-DL-glutamate epimerase-like enolase superfamily enzyme